CARATCAGPSSPRRASTRTSTSCWSRSRAARCTTRWSRARARRSTRETSPAATPRPTRGERRRSLLRVVAPEPAQGVREDGPAVRALVRAVPEDELVVVPAVLERRGHLLVGQRPVAPAVVEVVRAVLQEHADGPYRALADAPGVDAAAGGVHEAADVAHALAEEVGPLPGRGEGRDPAGAAAADRVALGVVGEAVALRHVGQ